MPTNEEDANDNEGFEMVLSKGGVRDGSGKKQ
jgi:hypothetical protein